MATNAEFKNESWALPDLKLIKETHHRLEKILTSDIITLSDTSFTNPKIVCQDGSILNEMDKIYDKSKIRRADLLIRYFKNYYEHILEFYERQKVSTTPLLCQEQKNFENSLNKKVEYYSLKIENINHAIRDSSRKTIDKKRRRKISKIFYEGCIQLVDYIKKITEKQERTGIAEYGMLPQWFNKESGRVEEMKEYYKIESDCKEIAEKLSKVRDKKISEADIELTASAIYYSSVHKTPALILTRDSDISALAHSVMKPYKYKNSEVIIYSEFFELKNKNIKYTKRFRAY